LDKRVEDDEEGRQKDEAVQIAQSNTEHLTVERGEGSFGLDSGFIRPKQSIIFQINKIMSFVCMDKPWS
jgi:hypothetical protein